jgi:hypothetical protein
MRFSGSLSVLILRIRRAESALADGRLDEAFEIAQSEGVRAHARGQKLIGRLVRSLVDRGRSPLEEERLEQASIDCEKAARLGGNLPEVCALRSAILAASGGHQEQAQRRQKMVHLGREHAAKGQLSLAEGVLTEAALDHAPARSLLKEVEVRRVAAEAAVGRARDALTREDWAGAIEGVLEARGLHAASQKLAEVTDQVTGAVLAQIRKAAESGRLDVASVLLERLRCVIPESVSVQEWSGILAHCRAARRAASVGHFRRVAESLRQLKATGCGPGWVDAALADAERAAESAEALQSGPLGWLSDAVGSADDRTILLEKDPPVKAPAALGVASPAGAAAGGQDGDDARGLASQLLFHVDAVGSFLVLRSSIVRIGPVSTSRRFDLSLSADPGLPSISIERLEDDYFLTAEKPVRVNDATVTRKLLASGDQIRLTPRCRIRFELPHPASTTAVLTVSGTRLPGSDARRVILMDRAMVMGPGPGTHVRADALQEPAVLVAVENRLMCRTGEAVLVDDRPMDRVRGLTLGARIRVGAVQFVVKPVS